jgi:hypothetical protein
VTLRFTISGVARATLRVFFGSAEAIGEQHGQKGTTAARDREYRSTPLAWAARTNAVAMIEFLIARGALMELPDGEPRAKPLAWVDRRGIAAVASFGGMAPGDDCAIRHAPSLFAGFPPPSLFALIS